MGQKHSINWKTIDSYTPEKQKAFLAEWVWKFRDERVRPRNIKLADHLIVERLTYNHHLICTEVKRRGSIMVMEYGPPPSVGEAFGSLARGENLVEIHEKEITFEELEKMKVRKIVWPRKLRRYSAKETVKKAKERKGERKYSLLNNNCEHFVVWCICGLSVSLQVKTWHSWLIEATKCLVSAIIVWIIVWLIKMATYTVFIDYFRQSESAAFFIVSTFIIVFEILSCCILANWESEGLEGQLIDITAKTWFQSHLGIAGLFVGSPYYPPLGSLVGSCLAAISKWYVESEPFESNPIAAILWVFKKGLLISMLIPSTYGA